MGHTLHIFSLCALVFVVVGFKLETTTLRPRDLKGQKRCSRPDEYECDNGQCLVKHSFCDGLVDCMDGSDETRELCRNNFYFCPPSLPWKCDYGACIASSRRCDLQIDCWDGSDEDGYLTVDYTPCPKSTTINQTQSTTQRTSDTTSEDQTEPPDVRHRFCKVPESANNRHFLTVFSSLRELGPGSGVAHSKLLIVTCDPGYSFRLSEERQMITRCKDGEWEHSIQECLKLCPPLPVTLVDMRCSITGCRSAGTEVQCKENRDLANPQRHKPNKITCGDNGRWSGPVPQCAPRCGVSSLETTNGPPATGYQRSKARYFPWNAVLYYNYDEGWDYVSLGTLISPRVVLVAAYNVVFQASKIETPRPVALEDLKVALGKQYKDWNVTEDMEERFGVQKLVLHPGYRASSGHYKNDIALLVLDRAAKITASVMPVCVDYFNSDAVVVDRNNTLFGYVVAQQKDKACSPSEDQCGPETDRHPMLYSHLPIVWYEECFSTLQNVIRYVSNWVTEDITCVKGEPGYQLSSNQGSGLTVPFSGRHFLFGVVSIILRSQKDDRVFGGVTDIYYHMPWLVKEMAILSENRS